MRLERQVRNPILVTPVVQDLPGGARLVTAPLPERSSTSAVLLLRVGSRSEPARLAGISHLIEHLVFKGTARRPTARDLSAAIEEVGGVMNAATDKEVTSFWARVPADRLELALDVLFDLVQEATLREADLLLERAVIQDELRMYLDQPQEYVHSLFEQALWPEHPLGRDIPEMLATLPAIGRPDLLTHLDRHYRAPRLVVSVSGSVDPAEVARLAAARVRLPPGDDPGYLPAPEGPAQPSVRLLPMETRQAHLCLGVRGLSYRDEDRYAIDLLSVVLGEGMSSRLFQEIREQRALAYDVQSYTSKLADTGYLAVTAGVEVAKAGAALEAIVAELRRLQEEEVPASELARARQFSKGRLLLALESTNAIASWAGQQLLLMGGLHGFEEIAAGLDRIDADGLRRVARRVLSRPLQLAVIGPFDSDAPFRAAIGAAP